MDLLREFPGLDEPAEVLTLRRQSADLLELLAGLAAEENHRLRRLVGFADLVAELRRIATSARRSSQVMQPQYAYDPEEPGIEISRRARERGVETQLVTRPSTVATHPLLSSIYPRTLLGPCFLRLLVVDERVALIGGVDDAEGNRVSWATDLPKVVDAVADLWRATVPLCVPILPEGEPPPLNERQLEAPAAGPRRSCSCAVAASTVASGPAEPHLPAVSRHSSSYA
jgi:hypothetical protein